MIIPSTIRNRCYFACMRFRLLKFAVACGISGAIWGTIVMSGIVPGVRIRPIWLAIVCSIAVGVAIGFMSLWSYVQDWWMQLLWPLVSLYVAVALSAILFGIYVEVFSSVPDQPPRTSVDVIAEGVLMFLWVFTGGFYFVAAWPLAFLNHLLLRKYAQTTLNLRQYVP